MTDEQVASGKQEATEPTALEAEANDEDAMARDFAADLEEVLGGQEEGIVTHW